MTDPQAAPRTEAGKRLAHVLGTTYGLGVDATWSAADSDDDHPSDEEVDARYVDAARDRALSAEGAASR
jgi:hypothetical protein